VSFEYRLAEDLPLVEGDQSQLRQVAMNLILNAAEAITGPGRVCISTSLVHGSSRDDHWVVGRTADAEYCQLEVSDNGTGMDDDTRTKVFDPFFSTKFSGRGLGLAAVGGIARSHGGAIAIDSKLGRGTTFRVVLPASAARPKPKSDAAPASAGVLGGKQILIVDDDDIVRRALSAVLKRHGCRVHSAPGGPAGLELYSRHHLELDLVVLDLTMPEMNGGEALERMRAISRRVPVVLMSGFRQEELALQFEGDRPQGFLAKPFKSDEVVSVLCRALTEFAPG
jgi:CheY-like chemotaxis protein